MSDDRFRELVKRMREAQREYFKERSPQWLNEAKRWEVAVDKSLAEDGRQKDLFGEDKP